MATGDGSYSYTNEPCHTAFSIVSEEEAHAAAGLSLHFPPLADGTGFNEPTIAYHAKVDERYAGGDGGEHEEGGVRYRFDAPQPLDLTDESSVLRSIRPASGLVSSVPFLGEHYKTITVASNGYVGERRRITTRAPRPARAFTLHR